MVNVSVIIPTYNREKLLVKCLNSLVKQSFKKFEVIVVDDGSKDNTKEIVNSFKKKLNISYVYQKNKCPAAARNNGISKAKASLIAFTDDDCIVSENWLKEISNSLKDKELAGVEGLTKARGRIGPFTQYINNLDGGMYVTCNIAYRKDAIKPGFDTNYPYPHREDADIAYGLIKKGKKIAFNKKMVVIHPAEKVTFKSVLRKKRFFYSDLYIFTKYPKQYKKQIKFPFEMFTPFYVLFTLISIYNPYFIISLFLIEIVELIYRKWHVNFIEFFKFFFLQVIGSFIILFSILRGLIRYKVNPFRLFLTF